MTKQKPSVPDTTVFNDLDPRPSLLMGPGPVNVHPRVLRAMSMPMMGQFDPQFTQYMDETMELVRRIFRTENQWSFLINGTARAGIEAALSSLITPGDTVLVPIFGRFGHLLTEIAGRCGANVVSLETDWGTVFPAETVKAAIERHKPSLVAMVHGDTSTTMAQPLDEIGPICRAHDALLYVDTTATIGGMQFEVDAWQIDIASAGLTEMPVGPAGIGADHLQRARRRPPE